MEKQISRQEMAGIIGAELEAKLAGFPPVEPAPPLTREVVVVLLEAHEDMYPVAVFSSMGRARETFEGSNLRVSYQRASFDPQDLDLEKLRRDA